MDTFLNEVKVAEEVLKIQGISSDGFADAIKNNENDYKPILQELQEKYAKKNLEFKGK